MSGIFQKVRERAEEIRGKAMGGKMLKNLGGNFGGKLGKNIGGMGKGKLGSGGLARQARTKADRLTKRVQERKPALIPMVKEFKPGSRVGQVFGQGSLRGAVTDSKRMSVSGHPREAVSRRKGRMISVNTD